MAEGIPSAFAVDLTRKWRALAERRKAYLVDLYDSGRWRLYYSEQEFVLRLREAIGVVDKWSATERSSAGEGAAAPNNPARADNGAACGEANGEALSHAGANGNAYGDDSDHEALSALGDGEAEAEALFHDGPNGVVCRDDSDDEALSIRGDVEADAQPRAGPDDGAWHDDADGEMQPVEDTFLERKRA